MKKLLYPVLLLMVLSMSCTRDKEPLPEEETPPPTGLQVKIDGVLTKFDVERAELFRDGSRYRNMLIEGLTADKRTKLVLIFREQPETGNGMSLKTYRVVMHNNSTLPGLPPNVDPESYEGDLRYGSRRGMDYYFPVHWLNGKIEVIQCDVDNKKISGKFSITARDFSYPTVPIEFTAGTFTDIGYRIAN